MRQTGFMAASAAYALTQNFPKLANTHELAKKLEDGLRSSGVDITGSAETCMVSKSIYNEAIYSFSVRCFMILLQLEQITTKLPSVPKSSRIH